MGFIRHTFAERQAYRNGLLSSARSTPAGQRSEAQKKIVKSYENGQNGVTYKNGRIQEVDREVREMNRKYKLSAARRAALEKKIRGIYYYLMKFPNAINKHYLIDEMERLRIERDQKITPPSCGSRQEPEAGV